VLQFAEVRFLCMLQYYTPFVCKFVYLIYENFFYLLQKDWIVNISQLHREGLHCVCLHVHACEWEREMENVRKHCGDSKMSI